MNAVVEDYVKTIYAFGEWSGADVTPSALAARLGLAASSVTEMVKKLAASGLVDHVPYGAITLTDEGRMLALRMVRRHRLIETWLVESFGYRWDEVHDEAEVLEHAVSDRMLEAIYEQLGRPTRDPHGDPIPTVDGVVTIPDAVALADAPDGHEGVIVRISDREPLLLQHLAGEGFAVDLPVVVVGRRPFGGALMVRLGGAATDAAGADAVDAAADAVGGVGAHPSPVDVGDDAASAIWVSR